MRLPSETVKDKAKVAINHMAYALLDEMEIIDALDDLVELYALL